MVWHRTDTFILSSRGSFTLVLTEKSWTMFCFYVALLWNVQIRVKVSEVRMRCDVEGVNLVWGETLHNLQCLSSLLMNRSCIFGLVSARLLYITYSCALIINQVHLFFSKVRKVNITSSASGVSRWFRGSWKIKESVARCVPLNIRL